ncbi:DUF3817 domain-containing protein [Nesterenkonia alba]|uniref:DUF3817 domain-containing protein n=1 Tax=Nesterenkonia alba TaxID=515814 RepID=UPI0004901A4C|nr:DUF3817 domain-containing protein [Nesterenkonia alba]
MQPTAWQTLMRVAFHVVAIVEAITWAGLLWAMYARYVLDDDGPMEFWGITHGIAFIVFCVVATVAWFTFRWKFWVWVVAILMAVPPLMTVPLEIWYHRTGKLKPQTHRAGPQPAETVQS